MTKFLAQFKSTETTVIDFTAVDETANKAINGAREKLQEFLSSKNSQQVETIVGTGIVPDQLVYDQLERDVRAVLYGSDDLRAHITIRTLPPGA